MIRIEPLHNKTVGYPKVPIWRACNPRLKRGTACLESIERVQHTGLDRSPWVLPPIREISITNHHETAGCGDPMVVVKVLSDVKSGVARETIALAEYSERVLPSDDHAIVGCTPHGTIAIDEHAGD